MNTSSIDRGRFLLHPGMAVLWGFMIIGLAIMLQSCATTSEDMSHRLYKADRAITESMLLATDLRTQGLINDEDWPKVKDGLNQARSEMTDAWASYDADPEGAAKNLGSIEGILEALTKRVPAISEQGSSVRIRMRPPSNTWPAR